MTKKQKTVISINPPPQDLKCECCGRHISKLKPFGKAGDPLVGDFDGQLLLKMFRAMTWHREEWDKILEEVYEQCRNTESWEDFESDLIKHVGKKKAQTLIGYDQLVNTVEASWECRECIVLYGKEFFEKRGH